MKSNVQMASLMVFYAVLLCSLLLPAQTAPTNGTSTEHSLSVLPIVKGNMVAEKSLTMDAPVVGSTITNNRSKRAIIFRPLFVYRQQQIKKQLVKDDSVSTKSNPDKEDFNYYAGQFPTRQ